MDILKGGHDKAKGAGLLIVGGHTIDDPEPKYGLAATGLVRPGAQVTIAGAQPRRPVISYETLGLGIMTKGIKHGVTSPEGMREAVRIMSTLNRAAAQAMVSVGVSAATDINGYGLLGHLGEVAQGSGVQIVGQGRYCPILEEARALAGVGVVPSGTFRNMSYLEGRVDWHAEVAELTRTLLADAQTSGGLAIAVSPGRAAALEEALRREGVETVALVGECLPAGDTALRVEP